MLCSAVHARIKKVLFRGEGGGSKFGNVLYLFFFRMFLDDGGLEDPKTRAIIGPPAKTPFKWLGSPVIFQEIPTFL